jgi:hypothetical protein
VYQSAKDKLWVFAILLWFYNNLNIPDSLSDHEIMFSAIELEINDTNRQLSYLLTLFCTN